MHNDSLVKKLAHSVKLFDGLSDEDIREFLANCLRRDIEPGEAVVTQGEYGQSMFVIVSGLMEVIREQDGLQQVLAVLEPGDLFGELAILDRQPRSATVRAVTSGLLLRFERGSLARIPQVAPKLIRNIALILSNRLRETNEMLLITLSGNRKAPASEPAPSRHYRSRS